MPEPLAPPTASAPPLLLACLCAAWCRLCDGYAQVLDDTAARLRADWPALVVRWIDIEDEAELVGDFDVETFPTLVLLRGDELLFAGALTPQPPVLLRVLTQALRAPAPPCHSQAPEAVAFAQRLRAQHTGHGGP